MKIWIGGYDETAFAETLGISFNIYFSGCSIRCEDCHNKELWEKESGYEVEIDEVVAKVKDHLEIIDTVCILGGEPTDQLEGLNELLIALNKLPVSIWLYSGREYDELEKMHIIYYIDFIKCGPYRKDIPPTAGSRLSSGNQKVYKHGKIINY